MSDASPTRQQTIEYVSRLLKMNPIHQGGEIIRARNELLRLETKRNFATDASLSRQHARNYRVESLEKLNAVRNAFWTLPLAELNAQVDVLENHSFDDVKRAAGRLRVVAKNRDAFLTVVDAPKTDTPFSDAQISKSLKEILIRSPRETVMLREHVRNNFGVRVARKLGTRMLRKLKSQLPDVYELEAEWFDSLQQRSSSKGMQLATPRSRGIVMRRQLKSDGSLFRYGWLVLIVVSAIGRLATNSDSGSNSASPYAGRRYAPPIQTTQSPELQQNRAADPSRQTPSRENEDLWRPFDSPFSDRSLQHSELNNNQKAMLRQYAPPVAQPIEIDGR